MTTESVCFHGSGGRRRDLIIIMTFLGLWMVCSNVEEMCRGGQRAGEGYLLLGLCRGAPFLFRWWTKKTEKKRSVFLVWLIIKIWVGEMCLPSLAQQVFLLKGWAETLLVPIRGELSRSVLQKWCWAVFQAYKGLRSADITDHWLLEEGKKSWFSMSFLIYTTEYSCFLMPLALVTLLSWVLMSPILPHPHAISDKSRRRRWWCGGYKSSAAFFFWRRDVEEVVVGTCEKPNDFRGIPKKSWEFWEFENGQIPSKIPKKMMKFPQKSRQFLQGFPFTPLSLLFFFFF